MAKTGINFERCNVASAEVHNTRNKAYIAAVNSSPNKKYDIFDDESKNNVSWVNPDYSGKTLPKILDELRALYKEKVGQAPQEKDRIKIVTNKKTGLKSEVTVAGWSPIREGVCPIKEYTKVEDFRPFIKWLEDQGVKVIRIDLHHDEGYTDLLTNERKHNHHAHIVADWVNHETGRTAKLNNLDASEMQTQIAQALGMERGESKTITGKEHLSSDRQRAKAEAAELERVKQKNEELRAEKARLEKQVASSRQTVHMAFGDLVEYGSLTVENFDKIVDNGGAVLPTKQEKEKRDYLETLCLKDYSKYDEYTELLNGYADAIHTAINQTQAAIKRIGQKLQEIASNIPTLSFIPSRKRKLLAHEAELERKAAVAQSESREAVKQAKIAQEKAIAEAQRIVDYEIEKAKKDAKRAKAEAERAKTAALNKEEAARSELRKYEELNANLELKIRTAKRKGFDDGYAKGQADEKINTDDKQQEIDNLKTEHSKAIEEWKKKYNAQCRWIDFCEKTNPRLAEDFDENYKELHEHAIWKFSQEEIIKLFSGAAVEKPYKGRTVRIEVEKSTKGYYKVWYDDKTLNDFLKIIETKKNTGMGGPH